MARPTRALAAALLAVTAGVATAVSAAPPALATHGSTGGGGLVDTTAHPGAVRAQITFVKRPAHPWDSRIRWRAWRQRMDGSWKLVRHDAWRAGSGLPGGSATNACVKNHGWLPDGRYSLRQYDDYDGSLIHGRAFRLSDKRCGNGTLREQLFIHTEAGPGNTQCANTPGDQICRWEFPKINDYTSHGCIKMSPADILSLTRDYHRYFRAGVVYPLARVSLLVRTR
ncbi:MAG TPA: hypothetical protein VHW64_17390 [Nocardioides sp.]|jgi:hypothetical protein|uniref:hypothetical protein n=1 Tax=Nocardioides sp. TaxID=35761 RepID=UPI002E34674C|nr:hypothetical protein [Nocardioides sp.]HEX3932473.1 hypothetical protein [Nocardioides sp.]